MLIIKVCYTQSTHSLKPQGFFFYQEQIVVSYTGSNNNLFAFDKFELRAI